MDFDFNCSILSVWKETLSSYQLSIESLNKPNLISLDEFYRNELPSLIQQRNPNPYVTTAELSKLMQWKLTRGKWRPRLLDFVSSLDESLVKSASEKAFEALPDLNKAISELTVLKGVGPATASAVLAAYAPHVAPFMSDEAIEAALGNSKEYSLKQYLLFANKLLAKAKITAENIPDIENASWESFTASDVERALWSSAIRAKLPAKQSDPSTEIKTSKISKRKRKR
ncbi:hypothetical protein EZV62_021740 [Acer yangbiense]|uniref:HhH-GPD domain-containing protein n=1 Tax=Acer yangbiense TaxID=1000413 RepID=A0A5C7H6J1_9ROSI|nr:hypothetical protein EZV62_021740 [Acer yangbiense]